METLRAMPLPRSRLQHGMTWLAAFEYVEPVRSMIHRAKYRAALPALRLLADASAARLVSNAGAMPDGVVAVPLGRRRLRQRGYNQAEVVARALAGSVHAPLLDGLVRVRETRPQAERDEAQRLANVDGAFAWRSESLDGKRLWLVDDVVTTGATARAAAAALHGAGAQRVHVLSVASVP
ncbi:MAG TPA: phosphoribosyltransferase family protein [Candidatus Dormibacteraeota bacterium]|nr:phosphoribosyltransferase family protein [Candidatus Dormibacteraeota bacterium]